MPWYRLVGLKSGLFSDSDGNRVLEPGWCWMRISALKMEREGHFTPGIAASIPHARLEKTVNKHLRIAKSSLEKTVGGCQGITFIGP